MVQRMYNTNEAPTVDNVHVHLQSVYACFNSIQLRSWKLNCLCAGLRISQDMSLLWLECYFIAVLFVQARAHTH